MVEFDGFNAEYLEDSRVKIKIGADKEEIIDVMSYCVLVRTIEQLAIARPDVIKLKNFQCKQVNHPYPVKGRGFSKC